MTPEDTLDRLVQLGCAESKKMAALGRWVSFDPPSRKPLIAELPDLYRAIRCATNHEHGGRLIADIDRMGRVIGWHLPIHPRT